MVFFKKKELTTSKSQPQLPVASLTERAIAKAEVRTALQQWQLAQMDSEKNGSVPNSNPVKPGKTHSKLIKTQ